ncbi:MAG: enoyl-CoA hydratase/isomerase family protein [Acetobacteraceae bacterium]|nr:enoyl-CoA hydratase/isomerase family protein [Acetobacteraceae bacterium]
MISRDFETLAVETPQAGVLLVRINRPQVANALNTQAWEDIGALWTELANDPGEARCAIFTGAGERAFCAGGDLKERNGMADEAWRRQHEQIERALRALLDCPIPVVAAVNGHAYAGGLELVLACDFAYAVRTARFALTETTLGIMPGAGGTQTLPRAIGERRAKEIILAARPFSAEDAHRWGLVNRLCEDLRELTEMALQTAGAIAANAPLAVRQAKKAIGHGLQMDLRTALRFEAEAYDRLVATEDRQEGVRAFNDKRKPVFRGR